MPSATITTIITSLAVIATDGTATNNFQDDVIYELSRGVYQDVLLQVGSAFIAVTAGTERYSIPIASGARTPLALFYDTKNLILVRKQEAWEYAQEWRRLPQDVIVGFTYDPEDRVQFALVPPPRRDGATIGGNTPTAVTTWPEGNVTIIYANTDLTFPGSTYTDQLLPVALEVLGREFGRDSNHQDAQFADVCHNLANFFFQMANPLGKPM